MVVYEVNLISYENGTKSVRYLDKLDEAVAFADAYPLKGGEWIHIWSSDCKVVLEYTRGPSDTRPGSAKIERG